MRRIHVSHLQPGLIVIDKNEARHVRDVLRLEHGTEVEIFDDAGQVATGVLVLDAANKAAVRVETERRRKLTAELRI